MPEAIYGRAPIDLGLVDLTPTEMMFWLYCPVKVPGDIGFVMPDNLFQFADLVRAVREDCSRSRWRKSYVYITAKTLWVSKESPGNRPGWHSDGFMTDDLNYVWSDRNGTEFWIPPYAYFFTQDHHQSLAEMEVAASRGPFRTYEDKHLLRLDQSVIHRVAEQPSGVRTFVKISVSKEKYNLLGNSINHALPIDWTYAPREIERNHTSGKV